MENSFTEKMRKLREKLDDTFESRQEFMGNLHNNVHTMRSNAQAFMEKLRAGHMDMARQMQDRLGGFRQKRRAFSEDLRAGAQFLHTQGSSRH
jgi:hypothetical protein